VPPIGLEDIESDCDEDVDMDVEKKLKEGRLEYYTLPIQM